MERLNLLEPSGSVQACTGDCFTFTNFRIYVSYNFSCAIFSTHALLFPFLPKLYTDHPALNTRHSEKYRITVCIEV